jgi:hypothetical protein
MISERTGERNEKEKKLNGNLEEAFSEAAS